MKERLAEIVNSEIQAGNIAGASICIIKDDKEIYYNDFGYADMEKKIPMKRDTIIRLYSMTKPVTAAAAMLLFERGIIDLYEPVSNYLPSFKKQMVSVNDTLVPVEREVTIRDLLNMTSGIVYPGDNTVAERSMGAVFESYISNASKGQYRTTYEYCNRMGECPLAFQPGEQWLYGASADVLGAVIEVASGKKFGEFLKEELFDPLGMVDTDFYVPADKVNRFAQNYIFDEKQKKLVPYEGDNLALTDFTKKPAFEAGGAGLVSTINDYSKFALMLLNEGMYKGKRILGKKTVRFMRTPQLTDAQQKSFNWDSIRGYSYGNLMRILTDKAKAATNASTYEYGWDGWTGNYFTIDPEEKLIFLYFIQRCNSGTTEATRKLRAITYGMIH
ncbi:serine hydrolase domain-containing protein [Clostridium sp. Marseille-P299]|uniref:serine hydrolase domain-containing protein n=1 Tax=Clostridium sp. Marseille-P299 TaxID=1805477 RepID=UPI00082D0894|nr:serine hydrolase domain-containing protein [Clostridium sp. Marseille-P299]